MKKALLLLLLTLMASLAFAQDSNQQLLDKLVEKNILTSQEAAEIAQETTKTEVTNDNKKGLNNIKKAINTPYLQLGGYALLHYSYNNAKDIKHNAAVRAAFLSIKGEAVKNLNYFALLNMRHGELTEYHVTWKQSDAFQLKAGQQKTPIAIENQMSLVVLEFIQNAKTIDYLVGGGYDVLTQQNGKHNSGRDIGLKMFGEFWKVDDRPVVEYAIGVFQGGGINSAANRNDKDLTANILLSPLQGFRIGGGVYFGQAIYDVAGATDKVEHVRNRWVLSSDYKSDRLTARAEYVRANDAGIDKEGVYGIATWSFIPQKWYLLGKIEYFNADKRVGREFMDCAGGINYHLTKTCRVQTNYTYTNYSKKWDSKNAHLVEAQFQIVY